MKPRSWLFTPMFRMCVPFLGLLVLAGCAEAEQGPHCRAYIECVRLADVERGTETNVDRFLPDGACWDGSKGAAVCESACRRGIPVLEKQEPTIACEEAP